MTRILVTGASGFLGRAVVETFAAEGTPIRAAVRRPPSPSFPSSVEVLQHADLKLPIDWRPYLEGIDEVVHLAAISQTGHSTSRDLYDQVNRQATSDLAVAAAKADVNRFVFISSIRAQTGPAADHALTERDQAAPGDSYGRSKLAAEEAVRASGVPFTILRPVMLYGPGVKGNFALLMRAANSPLPLPVKNFGNRRSLLSIDNFISALKFVLSAPATLGETYVLADPGMPPRFSDVMATLRQARGRRALLVPMSTDYVEWPLRLLHRSDIWDRIGGNLRVDCSKLIAAGWQPLHDTRTGLAILAQAAAPRKSGTASRSTR
jgi:UDP-glucose 4-epimerase